MFHDTGLPSPVPHVDFTVRSAALAREFAGRHGVPADSREVVTNAIAMHHSPGVGRESGPEAYLMSAGAAVDVFGSRSNEIPDAVRRSVVGAVPAAGLQARVRRAVAGGGQAGPSRPGVVPAPFRRHRPEHPDGAVRLTEHRAERMFPPPKGVAAFAILGTGAAPPRRAVVKGCPALRRRSNRAGGAAFRDSSGWIRTIDLTIMSRVQGLRPSPDVARESAWPGPSASGLVAVSGCCVAHQLPCADLVTSDRVSVIPLGACFHVGRDAGRGGPRPVAVSALRCLDHGRRR